jgi:3-carboxymethyl-3-hydroxy-acyl-[acp] dehydratase
MSNSTQLALALAGDTLRITLIGAASGNSLHHALLRELHAAIDHAEAHACKLVILQARGGTFCTGMDLEELSSADSARSNDTVELYMSLLRRFNQCPAVIVSLLSGSVSAGGVGLVAASDLVLATPRTRFTLPEIMWGLIPAMVAPYLIRRIGFQAAYSLALTAQPMDANRAQQLHLIDFLDDDLEALENRVRARLDRMASGAVTELKRYYLDGWSLPAATEARATATTARLLQSERVRSNLINFVRDRRVPWESHESR